LTGFNDFEVNIYCSSLGSEFPNVGFDASEPVWFVEYLLRIGGNTRQMSDQRGDVDLFAFRVGYPSRRCSDSECGAGAHRLAGYRLQWQSQQRVEACVEGDLCPCAIFWSKGHYLQSDSREYIAVSCFFAA
jgi:hypothetical protein